MEKIKLKLQIDTEKAENFIKELAEIANKYEIGAKVNGHVISFDLGDLLKIIEIRRLVGGEDDRSKRICENR